MMNKCPVNISEIVETQYYTYKSLSDVSSNILLKIVTENQSYVLKIYTNGFSFESELDVMFLLMKNKCKTPNLIKYGKNWILYEYIDDISFSDVRNQISNKDQKLIFQTVGKELRKIHGIRYLNTLESKNETVKYIETLTTHIDIFAKISNNNPDSDPLLFNAIEYLRRYSRHIPYCSCCLVLYDFNEKHLIVMKADNKWILNAIIDFEEAKWGCAYQDVTMLFINNLLYNKELEDSFWNGYLIKNEHHHEFYIIYFLLYHALELCTTLRHVHSTHYERGISLLKKTFSRINLNNFQQDENSRSC